jgi:hypothetical protein
MAIRWPSGWPTCTPNLRWQLLLNVRLHHLHAPPHIKFNEAFRSSRVPCEPCPVSLCGKMPLFEQDGRQQPGLRRPIAGRETTLPANGRSAARLILCLRSSGRRGTGYQHGIVLCRPGSGGLYLVRADPALPTTCGTSARPGTLPASRCQPLGVRLPPSTPSLCLLLELTHSMTDATSRP